MATPRKSKTKADADETYSKLDEYCIWLHEFHRGLRKAGFSNDNALWIAISPESYPEWVSYKKPTEADIQRYLDEEED